MQLKKAFVAETPCNQLLLIDWFCYVRIAQEDLFASCYNVAMTLYNIILLHAAAVQKVLLQVLDGNFYKVVLLLIQSPYSEVQYNCSAILGNLILHCEWSDDLTKSSVHMAPHS